MYKNGDTKKINFTKEIKRKKMEEKQEIRLFKKILKQLIKELEAIQNVDVNKFEEAVIEAFDGYHYEGEDEVVGIDKWPDLNVNGDFEINAKVNHEDAYELTLFLTSKDGKITVNNVL